MTTLDLVFNGWNANPYVIAGLVGATVWYVRAIGRRGRPGCFAAALLLVAIAFLSPLNLLAGGVLFSAHMAQHILLLLLIPGLVLLSLPPDGLRRAGARTAGPHPNGAAAVGGLAVLGWILGVGSMWFWHVPQLCNAAASNVAVHAGQSISLLAMGAAFWWPILAPRPEHRLLPGLGIAYLFTACLACTGLGIVLTLSSFDVCPIFRAPSRAPAAWVALRDQLTAPRDQQIGGLLMWLPMCLVYLAAIVLELARWLGEPAPKPAPANRSSS